ncbi:MAG: hypothetical protein P4M11_10660 [Candidatus Pacebacteria bacterium]|nr:hypothetical protein [Candidatus Paceibacterota bacterium]
MKPSVDDIKSSFIIHSSEGDKSLEVIENFEMTAEFKQLVGIPYLKEKFYVSAHMRNFVVRTS